MGASAIQVGTANFANPRAAVEITEELRRYCEERGTRIADLVGQVELSSP